MSKIKLFSGMDFSGKTTIIEGINNRIPNKFKIKKKFLTPIKLIETVRKRKEWLSPEEWKPLLQENIKKDIEDYREDGLILLDSLWVIKYLAGKIEKDNKEDEEEIFILKDLLRNYPSMDSFYITTTIDERIKRLEMRIAEGKEITGSDKVLFSAEKFEKIEKNYRSIILKRFPDTKIIDTTYSTPEESVKDIIEDEIFLKDI